MKMTFGLRIDSQEAKRTFTRIACDPLVCKPGLGNMPASRDDIGNKATSALKEDDDDGPVIDLISGLLPEKVEEVLTQALDDLCPELADTPKLQDKALRLVFSVGVDVAMLDAESSAYVGKFGLHAKDMLSSETTEELFGSFIIPRKPKNS